MVFFIGDYMVDELNEKRGKSNRILSLYARLSAGKIINKSVEAKRFGVNEKSIQRDLDEIRIFLENQTVEDGIPNELIYDRREKGYKFVQGEHLCLTNAEILAVSKILLDSRAFTKKEMDVLIDKLVDNCVPKQNQKLVNDLLMNEKFHYVEPRHKRKFLDKLLEIGKAINESYYIEFEYKGLKSPQAKKRKLQPVSIMFSEYYFYLVGFLDGIDKEKDYQNPDDPNPTIFRIDRMEKLVVTNEHFSRMYSTRFEEGEFRKRVQFMFGGRLRRIKFKYTGYSIESILDRLPTAEILEKLDDGYIVSAEVFGDGIDMWLRSQGDNITII